MNEDIKLKEQVINELEWDASINASRIGVAAKDGIITLTGVVKQLCGKEKCRKCCKTYKGY